MHQFVTSNNVKWCHLIWPTLHRKKPLIGFVKSFSVSILQVMQVVSWSGLSGCFT